MTIHGATSSGASTSPTTTTALRIGELAELAGVTTRTIRHYHHVGLLPEPERAPNGYRTYRLHDAVRLLRVRRLVELGLNLDEVADALGDDEGRELREILTDLEADLAAQERRIGAQRERIAALLARTGNLGGSPDQAEVLAELERVAGADHPGLDRERQIAELIEPTAGPDQAPQAWEAYRRALADPELTDSMLAATREFEALAGLDPHDPAVERLAHQAGGFGAALGGLLPEQPAGPTNLADRANLADAADPADPAGTERFLRTVTAGMDPAQARCLRLMVDRWREDLA